MSPRQTIAHYRTTTKLGEVARPGLPYYDVTSAGRHFLISLPDSRSDNAPITVVLNWWAGLKRQ